MLIDVTQFLGSVKRDLSTREKDGETIRVLTLTRTYATDQADLWDALTNGTRIPKWFLPISGDLKLGGRYQFEGNAGGTITRCDGPDALDVTWEFGGMLSWVEVRLEPCEEGTQFTLEHIAMVPDEMWAQFGPGAVGCGWESCLLGMSRHIEHGETMNPADGMAWMMSDNGKEFFTECSQRWIEASIAFGTPREEAEAAGQRTTAAYTGQS